MINETIVHDRVVTRQIVIRAQKEPAFFNSQADSRPQPGVLGDHGLSQRDCAEWGGERSAAIPRSQFIFNSDEEMFEQQLKRPDP